MRKVTSLKLTVFITVLALMLAGCSAPAPAPATPTPAAPAVPETTPQAVEPAKPTEVEITDIYGTVTVPVNPQRVVALDNRTFQTLEAWGVELVAGPKPVMPAALSYKTDDSIQDVGSHNDPNLEVIAAVNPDLVIVGQRFASQYDAIKELVPTAAVINLNFDVSVNAESSADNLVNGFRDYTLVLGQIFDKNAEAAQMVADFEASIERAKAAYNGTDTIMTIIVSGGNIRFAAPLSGRVWGPLYEIFDWQSSLFVDGASSDHQGDDISVEAIAQSNPDWIFVLDRDAMNATAEGYVPAYDIIANAPALANISAVTEGKMVYAPNDAYVNESIQTFTALFNTLADAMAG
jgi:ABC-type enterochelin transport system, periplasmic component